VLWQFGVLVCLFVMFSFFVCGWCFWSVDLLCLCSGFGVFWFGCLFVCLVLACVRLDSKFCFTLMVFSIRMLILVVVQ